MRHYQITLKVSADNLTTILEVVKDAADLVEMKQVNSSILSKSPARRSYANGKHDKGITGRNLVLQTLNGKSWITKASLDQVFLVQGFSQKSVSPVLTDLVREGRIMRERDSFRLAAAGES